MNIIEKRTDESNKFAIVGYTDHAPDNGHFPNENPVSVFPSDKRLESGEALDAANFIGEMKTGGGGGQYGEALLDGIAEANKLEYRPMSCRTYILLCDDCPHGDEFSTNTTHPTGCPCGYSWRELLRHMKAHKTHFIFVQLSNLLNKTISLFQEEYEGRISVMSLNDVSEFAPKVTQSLIQTINKNLVYSSNKFRK